MPLLKREVSEYYYTVNKIIFRWEQFFAFTKNVYR